MTSVIIRMLLKVLKNIYRSTKYIHYKKTGGYWRTKSSEVRRNIYKLTNFWRKWSSVSFRRKKKFVGISSEVPTTFWRIPRNHIMTNFWRQSDNIFRELNTSETLYFEESGSSDYTDKSESSKFTDKPVRRNILTNCSRQNIPTTQVRQYILTTCIRRYIPTTMIRQYIATNRFVGIFWQLRFVRIYHF